MKALANVAVACLLPWPALAEMTLLTTRYGCERGVTVPATWINADDGTAVVVSVEGRQITLQIEQSASGARYGWPSDGSSYVWWTKGAEAVLSWKDETGAETPVLSQCKEAG